MHSLKGIIRMNNDAARKAVKVEDNHNRHCSYSGDVENGLVLHSAKLRNTVFVSAGAHAKKFLAGWFGTNSAEKRDSLVESYFGS